MVGMGAFGFVVSSGATDCNKGIQMSFLTASLIVKSKTSDPEEGISWGVGTFLYALGHTDISVYFTLSSFMTCPLPLSFIYAHKYWRAESGTCGGGTAVPVAFQLCNVNEAVPWRPDLGEVDHIDSLWVVY